MKALTATATATAEQSSIYADAVTARVRAESGIFGASFGNTTFFGSFSFIK